VVSKLENGKEKQWKRLDQVWEILHDETKVIEYIRKKIHIINIAKKIIIAKIGTPC
jgi:hypothetical protein